MRRMRSMQRKQRRQGGIRPEIVRRIVIFGLLVLILSAAMSSFFAQLTSLPATPDLILGAVIAVALLDGRASAAIVAVAGGVAVDALGGVGASLSPLLYLGVVLTVGFLSEKMLPGFLSFSPCTLWPRQWKESPWRRMRRTFPPVHGLFWG